MIINNKSLTYCSNIFKEKTLYDLLEKIEKYAFFLRKTFKKKWVGLSLCMSNKLIIELHEFKKLIFFGKWLKRHNFYLSSLNGFVYKVFHKKKIKENIYYPDWTSKNRNLYTKKLIMLLVHMKTGFNNSSISTMPISFRNWCKKKDRKYIFFRSSVNILDILNYLVMLNKKKKCFIHLDIEPEPFCLIESFENFLNFYFKWLIPNLNFCLYISYIKRSLYYLKKYINLCYDICHFSVNYYNHDKIISSILKNKLKVGKVQVSSALEVFPDCNNKTIIINELFFLTKSKFLHQNTAFDKNNSLFIKNSDIIFILNKTLTYNTRIHCHMPLYLTRYKKFLKTTSEETKAVFLKILNQLNVRHVEIETYTYDMLLKNEKFSSIVKEYTLVINLMRNMIKNV